MSLVLACRALCVAQEPDVRIQSGLDAYLRREYKKAADLLSPLLAGGDSGRPDAVAALGLSLYFLGDYKRAQPALEKASAWSPRNVEFAYTLGLCSLRQRDFETARAAFARMFELPPDSPRARLITARFLVREDIGEQAVVELRAAAQQAPGLPELHYLLGELAILHGDFDGAIRELETEISINPLFSMAYYRLGDAYTRKDKWDDAVAPLQKAIWLNPDFSSPYFLLGKTYQRKRQLDFAEGMLKRGLELDPNNASGHYLLGTLYRESGRQAESQREFELVRKLKKQDSPAGAEPPNKVCDRMIRSRLLTRAARKSRD